MANEDLIAFRDSLATRAAALNNEAAALQPQIDAAWVAVDQQQQLYARATALEPMIAEINAYLDAQTPPEEPVDPPVEEELTENVPDYADDEPDAQTE